MSKYEHNTVLMKGEKLDESFRETPVWDQLGKIIDSESARDAYDPKGNRDDYFRKFNGTNIVKTDDDYSFVVTTTEATKIREIIAGVHSKSRLAVLRHIQLSSGFKVILDQARSERVSDSLSYAGSVL